MAAKGKVESRLALASNLKWWRKQRRLSTQALSRISHVPESLIRDIEAGEQYEEVRLGSVQALARGLELPVPALLSEERSARRPKA